MTIKYDDLLHMESILLGDHGILGAFLHSTTALLLFLIMCKLQTRLYYESFYKTLQFRPLQHILQRFIERLIVLSGL